MRIVAAHVRAVEWPIAATGANVRGAHSLRRGTLIELRDEDGHVGLGEATPLDSSMQLQTQLDLEKLATSLPIELADDAGVDEVAAFAVARMPSPAGRFAIEVAIGDLLARRRGIALATWWSADAERSLPTAIVVDSVAEARAAVAAGARTLKLKLDGGDDFSLARDLATAAPGIALRFDVNRRWLPRYAELRVRELHAVVTRAGGVIDFVEEPCDGPIPIASGTGAERLPARIALDETIVDIASRGAPRDQLDRDLPAVLAWPGVRVVILKPTELGVHATLDLARRARAAGVTPIVTHALEGPIGTAACAELARAIGGDADVGLGPHPAIANWRIAVPQLGASAITAAPAAEPGLGFARADNSLASMLLAAPGVITIVATPTPDTLAIIRAALAAHRPIALVHHRLAADEQARQRAAVAHAHLPADAAAILFTSGSTGTARGIVLSRGALLAAAASSAAHLGWRDDDRWLLALSTAHAGGLSIVVRCFVAGKPVVLLDGDFEPAHVAALLRDERVTIASLVPTQLAALLDDPHWHPPAHLRAVLLGGAAASPTLLAAAAARGVPFLTTYGMTETLGQVVTQPLAAAGTIDPAGELGAIGLPLPGVEITAGTAEAPAPIVIRSAQLATCTLDGAPIAPALTTADLGWLDARGALHVTGRADDVIITGGENVHPSQIEAVLATTPGVRAACVFGVTDERYGQLVGAAIAIDDATFELAAARARWHAALPAHARPRRLAITSAALPQLATGKIDRRAASELPAQALAYTQQ